MNPVRSKIIKDVSALITRSIFIRVLRIPVAIIIARVLGPSGYGLLQIIAFIPGLTKYGSLGYDSVAFREISHFRGEGEIQKEGQVRDIAFTSDLVWSLCLSSAVIFLSFYYNQPTVRWGLRIASITLVLNQVIRLYVMNLKLEKSFTLLAKVQTVTQMIGAVFVVATIWWWGIFSVLVSALISSGIAVFVYHKTIGLRFRPAFERLEWWRLTKIAAPMSLATLAFGMFGWAERGVVLSLLGLETLGVYMLTVTASKALILVVSSLLVVISPHLYQRLGRGTRPEHMGNILNEPTFLIAYVLPLAGAGLIFLGPPFILKFLPRYEGVIDLLPLLFATAWIRAVPAVYFLSMNSARLNQQVRLFVFWVVAIVVFSLGTWVLWRIGLGIMAAMAAKFAAFTLLTVLGLVSTMDVLWESRDLFWRDLKEYLVPFVWSAIIIGILMQFGNDGWVWGASRMMVFVLMYFPLVFRLERKLGFFAKMGLPFPGLRFFPKYHE